MPKGDEITTKFRVDISDLKKGMTEANKNIRLANAQFKAASAGMDDWIKSSAGLTAKLKQLESVLASENAKLKSYKDQLKEIQKAEQENGKRADELKSKLQQLSSQGVSKTSAEYKKYEKALNEVEKEQLANGTASDKLKITILNQQGAVAKTEKEMRNYGKALDTIENETDQAEKATDDLADELKNVNDTANKSHDGFTVMKGALASLVADGFRIAIQKAKEFGVQMLDTAAAVKAETSMFNQTFGDMGDDATAAIDRVAKSSGILATRLNVAGAQIYAFARSNGGEATESMELMEDALQASADSAAYYDKSLDETTETLQSFLKGNYENDAALGTSATEFTRNAKASELFGKKFNDLTEIQKQKTLLKMVTDSQKLSGAMGQASREADGWENVQGNLNETWRQFQAQVGTPFLQALIPVVQDITAGFKAWADSVDWNAFSQRVKAAINVVIDVFSWFIENRQIFISAILGMIAAFAVMKIAAFGTAIAGVITALTSAPTIIAGVTSAMKLMNITALANPYVALAAGITAVVVALGTYLWSTKKSTDAVDKDIVATDKLVKKHKELNNELKESKKSRNESIKGATEQGATADILFNKLEKLRGVENKSNAEKATMSKLVSELNTIMPELNLKYDEEKDKLNLSTEAIKNNITAQKELLKAKAAQENLTKIAEDMAKAEIEQGDLIKQNTTNEKAYAKAQEERVSAYEAYAKTGFETYSIEASNYQKAIANESDKKKAYDNTNKTLADNKKKLQGLNSEYNKTDEYAQNMFSQADIQQQLGKLTETAKAAGVEIPQALVDGMEAGIYAVPESIKQMESLMKFDDALTAAGLAGTQIPTSISQGVIKGKTSVKDAIAQVNDVVNFNSSLEQAKSQGVAIPKDLSKNMLSGKMSVKEASTQLSSAVNFNTALKEAETKGIVIPSKLADNIKKGKVTVDEANALLNDAVKFDTMVNEAGIKGTALVDSLSNSIKTGKMKPQQAIDEINALTKYDKLVQTANQKGIQIPLKIEQGILSGKTKPSKAVTQMNALINYQDALTKANLNGAKVPEYFSKNIANGNIKVKNANSAMNKLIQFQTALDKAGQSGVEIPDTLAKKIVSGKTTVEKAKTQMNNWIQFQAALETTKAAGVDIPKKLQDGILSGKTKPKDAIKQLNDQMKTEANKAPTEMKKTGGNAGESYAQGISSKKGEAKNAGEDLIEGANQGVRNQSKQNSVFAAVGSFGNSILARLKSSLQEKSPSKATDEMGQFLLIGLGNGIAKKVNSVLTQVTVFGGKVLKTFRNASGNYETLGKSLVSQYEKGINSSVKSSISTVTSLVNKVTSSLSKSNKNASKEYTKAGTALMSAYSTAITTGANKAIAAVNSSISKIGAKAQEQYDKAIADRAAFRDRLSNSPLYYEEDGQVYVNDLKKSTKEINDFGKNIEKLKNVAPDGLMNEILAMDTNTGVKFTDELLSLSTKELNDYITAYKKRESAANTVSKNFYSTEINSIKKNFNESVTKEMNKLQSQLKTVGKDAMSGFVNGMNSKNKALTNSAKTMATAVVKAFKKELKIKSPSKVFEMLSKFIPEGVREGITNNTSSAVKAVKSMSNKLVGASQSMLDGMNVPQLQPQFAGGTRRVSSTAINNNYTQVINAPKQPSRIELYRQTKNLLALKGGK